jgi:CheY-like chemotaxis protein/HPt (histidine-containing phosphotransfer) domain-containing protein
VGVSLREVNNQGLVLYFSVTDSGIGMSPRQMENLFQSFQQADTSTTRLYGGTGLGLAIAKQLAELMDGCVGVQSALGEGSCFWFEVPLELAQDHPPSELLANTGSEDWQIATGTRVLLVEDNALNQQVATELLQLRGCSVDVVANGLQALERLRQERYALVFMDMQMPVLDGLSATRQLRQLPGLGQLPVIAMTANAMVRDRDACLAAGMNDFLSKPFEPDALYAVLRRWLTADGAIVSSPVQPVLVSTSLPELQLDDVDMVAGMRRVLGKHSLYQDLLFTFLNGQGSLLEELKVALDTHDVQAAELLLHSCKGVSATLGAHGIAQAAGELEQGLSDGWPVAAIQQGLDALAVPLTRLLKQLREQLHADAETTLVDVDALQVSLVGGRLAELLGDFDAAAVDFFSEHADLLHSAFTGRFRQLKGAVQRFDFEQALSCLNQALQEHEAV